MFNISAYLVKQNKKTKTNLEQKIELETFKIRNMKTSVKQIATGTFIALLLMVGNVKATELKPSSLESIESIEKETTFQIENWMVNDLVCNKNSINIAKFVQEVEPVMELENWMTNYPTWNTSNNDNEPKLTVENWMFNDSIWE